MLKIEQQWFAVLAFCATTILPLPTFAASPTYISEISWAGSSLSASDEWVEIANTANVPLDISKWSLTGAASKNATITIPEGSIVAANSTFVIGNYDAQHGNSALTIEPNLVTTSLSLPNSGFHLHLMDNDHAVIDVAGGTGTPFAGGSGGTADALDGRYTSMVRVDGSLSGEEKTNWTDATVAQNLLDKVSDYATPGRHPVALTETEESAPTLNNELPPEEEVIPTDEHIEEDSQEPPTEEIVMEPTVSTDASKDEVTLEEESLTDPLPSAEHQEDVPQEVTISKPSLQQVLPNLIVSEFLAAPETGQEEWIEIQNIGETSVGLSDWTLEDEGGKQTTLDGLVKSEAFFVIVKPEGKLNNDGDSIILKNEHGNEVLSLTYGSEEVPSGKKGESVALDGNTYHPTQIHTPGTPNLIFIPMKNIQELGLEETAETELVPEIELELKTEEMQEAPLTTMELSSIYPNTHGSDETEEYLELKNSGTETVTLDGWKVSDASGKKYVFKNQVQVAPGEVLRLNRTETKIALNNTAETIMLHAPNKELIDQVSYTKSTKGETYNRNGDTWTWSQTQAVEQVSVTTQKEAQTLQTTPTPTSAGSKIPNNTINELTKQSIGTRATVTGVVTAVPNTLGKQFMYIQDETGGIQVYFYKATFPELELGDVISVTGELSNARGEHRLKISDAGSITNINDSRGAQTEAVAIADVNNQHIGKIIETSGMIQSKGANKLTLEHNGEMLTVHLGSGGVIITDSYQRGDKLTVTGIVSIYDNNLRVRPRSQDDIVMIEEKKNEEAAPIIGSTKNNSPLNNQGQAGTLLLLLTFVAFVGLAIARLIPRQKPMNA
ncbi:MAG: lamin tail domain-containing protein [bacterium]|nr:lamin tail domain-containing protein [bacterium]